MRIKIILALITVSSIAWFASKQNESKQDNSAIAQILKNHEQKIKYATMAQAVLETYEKTFEKLTPQDYQNAKKTDNGKVKFCIVAPAYNNIEYATKNIKSVFMQDYHNWRMVYVDDASTDGTGELVKNIQKNFNDESKFKAIIHTNRKRAPLYGFYEQAHDFCHDDEVMVFLDGDDMLSDKNILSKLANIYEDDKIWITYGSWVASPKGFIGYNNSRAMTDEEWKDLRSAVWVIGQLRTAYTWLFKKIDINDLQFNGDFYRAGGDVAWLYPMLEMAGKNRTKYISDITCIYHLYPNNDAMVHLLEQVEMAKHIRSLKKYERIK